MALESGPSHVELVEVILATVKVATVTWAERVVRVAVALLVVAVAAAAAVAVAVAVGVDADMDVDAAVDVVANNSVLSW